MVKSCASPGTFHSRARLVVMRGIPTCLSRLLKVEMKIRKAEMGGRMRKRRRERSREGALGSSRLRSEPSREGGAISLQCQKFFPCPVRQRPLALK